MGVRTSSTFGDETLGAPEAALPYPERVETVLLYILGIVIVVVGLAVSIGLHEVGHLVPAKRFGVKVGQYMIGFGPTLWSRRFGETEYGIKAIPLGGYISMAGMFPPARTGGRGRNASTGFFQLMVQDARTASADTVAPGEEARAFYRLPVWKRVVVMLGGPFMNLVLGFVFFAIVLMGFGVPQTTTVIGSVSECVVPISSERTECTAADPLAPAAEAGILPGDRIVSIDGTEIATWEQATEIIRANPGEPLGMIVERDGARVPIEATPLLTERPVLDGGDGTVEVGFLGIGSATANVRQPITAVPGAVWDQTVAVGRIILTLPARLYEIVQVTILGQERDPNGPISVVGVGRLAGEITSLNTIPVEDRAATLLGMLGGLNIALFVFNLVPLMPLDGGHVAGAVWEAIRRRFARWFQRPDPGPVDTARLIPFTLAIVAVLGVTSALLIVADIVNPISIL